MSLSVVRNRKGFRQGAQAFVKRVRDDTVLVLYTERLGKRIGPRAHLYEQTLRSDV